MINATKVWDTVIIATLSQSRNKQIQKAKPPSSLRQCPNPFLYDAEDEGFEEEYVSADTLQSTCYHQPVSQQSFKPQPRNLSHDITAHYQLLQNKYLKQKQEKCSNLCEYA